MRLATFNARVETVEAALWDRWKNRETGERIISCTMVITQPNDFVAEVHDRMPVLLMPEQFDRWLKGEMGVEELKPAPNDYLQRWQSPSCHPHMVLQAR